MPGAPPSEARRRAAISLVTKAILKPLTRPHCLETLRLIGAAGEAGITRAAIQPEFGTDRLSRLDPLLAELTHVRAIRATADRADARKRRYRPTPHLPRFLTIGEALNAWVAAGPFRPFPDLSTKAAERPLHTAVTIWAEGLTAALHSQSLTVQELAASLDATPTRIRHIVDRASHLGLLEKHPGPGGQNLISTSALFGALVPTAARATLYMAKALGTPLDFFTEVDLRTAIAELLKALTFDEEFEATIALRVYGTPAGDVSMVVNYEDGAIKALTPRGDSTAKVESDLLGWLTFLADADRSNLNWSGRGPSSLLKAIEALPQPPR